MNVIESTGYSCNAVQYPDNQISEGGVFQPVTPDWCPLKKGMVIVKLKE